MRAIRLRTVIKPAAKETVENNLAILRNKAQRSKENTNKSISGLRVWLAKKFSFA